MNGLIYSLTMLWRDISHISVTLHIGYISPSHDLSLARDEAVLSSSQQGELDWAPPSLKHWIYAVQTVSAMNITLHHWNETCA